MFFINSKESNPNKVVSYEKFIEITENFKGSFKPDDFININKKTEHLYSKVTSYPNRNWSNKRMTTFEENALKPTQITFYYIKEKENMITKVNFVYAPTSQSRDYLLVDYHDVFGEGAVEEPYNTQPVTPYYMVGFSGKGYHVYVSTTFTEDFYRNNKVETSEKNQLLNDNAEMVRQVQEFLINNKL